MRLKIQKSMMVILAVTLVLFYVILSVILYNQNMSILRAEVKQEAKYICTAVNISGTEYLEQMDNIDESTRVTRIDESGNVLYDSRRDADTLDNHSGREEVREALKSGEGEDVRRSVTVEKDLYYYALLLEDGSVLRVSREVDSLASTALTMLPVIGGLAVLMIIFAMLLAKWQTARLIKPINELDLEQPLDNDVYAELSPLLTAMDRQNREKEAVSNMRKEFSANVSHELKTPLTSISGYAEIMKNGMVRPADIPVFSERIYKEARRLITLVEDIIKLSKLDEESVELEKQEVDLYDLTREIVSRLSPQASQKNIRMELTGEPVKYVGIRQILDEMVYNVCENAIKYNNDGGRVTVWVGNTLEGPKISVADTGIGIPKEHHERIFERFYRVDKSHSKERGGTGLGLSIVKHGALLHGAKVSVDSSPGRGTKIEMQF
ncbi:sensor histidine kinase [[Ruminococcus] torques]|uniref:sensor histidine kinase n=1 Tax=[Ruminococcus] torques TaxID=33039 RepID=UPI0025A41469|nr:ATP-binding protein [[Ruminococcus] torques]MDM8237231.1 ATP-binding protein [[Ruminococcus] torques]